MAEALAHALRRMIWTCACMDVAVGTYANQVEVPMPDVLGDLRAARREAGWPETICLDRCVVEEVQGLWALDIRTTGACCGHNKLPPYIGVEAADIERMKALGYQVQVNPNRPTAEDSFIPNSVFAVQQITPQDRT